MPPTHAKKPAAMKEKCAHGGPLHCSEGCYSKGGGVHPVSSASLTGGESEAGLTVRGLKHVAYKEGREQPLKHAKEEHHRVLGEMRADKTDRRNLAEGGDVEPLDEPMQDDDHEELESTLAGELLHAMEKKDKKGVVDAIEALVLQCMNKGGM